jgi:hypothetical protein
MPESWTRDPSRHQIGPSPSWTAIGVQVNGPLSAAARNRLADMSHRYRRLALVDQRVVL